MKTVTNTYSVSYLSTHPRTKNIVHKYLLQLAGGEEYLGHLHSTLDELAEYNMGGGIPYDVMVELRSELNTPEILECLSYRERPH